MSFENTKTTLLESFNPELAADINIDINVTVLGSSDGKFSVSVHAGECEINVGHLDKSDITVGFTDDNTMLEMFTQGANPMGLVMGGKMTINGDLKKGREIKGLFVK
jgi:hypothetical protein